MKVSCHAGEQMTIRRQPGPAIDRAGSSNLALGTRQLPTALPRAPSELKDQTESDCFMEASTSLSVV